jgi:hypothetical protein
MPIRRSFFATSFASSLLAVGAVAVASAAVAADAPPVSTDAADAPPPTIEVVQEGGGVADVWRREGVDFPAYGPTGQPVVPTAERQALQALANAYDVRFIALAPPPEGVHPMPCSGDCVGGLQVRGRVPVQTIAHYRLARSIGDSWLREGSGGKAAGMPEFRHALTYSADGHAWEVLLCYACGQYLLRRDGIEVGNGGAGGPIGRVEFDALLEAGGVGPEDAGA